MNWARERASEILNSIAFTADETREEIIAAELQRVVDECVKVADAKSSEFSFQRTIEAPIGIDRQMELLNRAIGAIDTAVAIRAKFPKEEMYRQGAREGGEWL